MKIVSLFIITLLLLPVHSYADKSKTIRIIANEPVTMMDLGIIKLNTSLSRQTQPGLRGATLGAKFNSRKETIDIKVTMPVKKASKAQCKKVIQNTKKIFISTYGKKKTSNIHHYFQHEGTGYRKRINWDDLGNHVVITGIVLTKRNFQDSVYCQSRLMKDKVTY